MRVQHGSYINVIHSRLNQQYCLVYWLRIEWDGVFAKRFKNMRCNTCDNFSECVVANWKRKNNCILFADDLRVIVAIVVVTAIATPVYSLFRTVRKELVLGPNTQVRLRYWKTSRVRESSSWLLLKAPLGQQIEADCVFHFSSPTPGHYCTENIFYYNKKSSTSLEGAHFICNTNTVRLVSRFPSKKNRLIPQFLLFGNFDLIFTRNSDTMRIMQIIYQRNVFSISYSSYSTFRKFWRRFIHMLSDNSGR